MGDQAMSYSRWTDSRFYTYWDTTSYGDEEHLMIDCGREHAYVSFTLCKNRPNEVAAIFAKTPEESTELLNILARFVSDIENR